MASISAKSSQIPWKDPSPIIHPQQMLKLLDSELIRFRNSFQKYMQTCYLYNRKQNQIFS